MGGGEGAGYMCDGSGTLIDNGEWGGKGAGYLCDGGGSMEGVGQK